MAPGTPRHREQLTEEDWQPVKGRKALPRWYSDVAGKLIYSKAFNKRKEGASTSTP